MGFDRLGCEEVGSEDSCGRALWAIGVTAAQARQLDLRIWASSLYDQAAGMALELNYPRARGFAMLGAALMLAAHPDHEISLRILRERSEEHTSELQSLMRISYAVFCLKKKKTTNNHNT